MIDRGDWIITWTGKQFYCHDPRPEDIDVVDIAHSLAMLNRYVGHTNWPYSVAQHSVLVSYQVPQEQALGALLHDAAEAYICDLPRPLKHSLRNYIWIENDILEVIDEKFGVTTATPEIKLADTRMLVTEARVLCNGPDWYNDAHYPPAFADVEIEQWSWKFAKLAFLERFEELNND